MLKKSTFLIFKTKRINSYTDNLGLLYLQIRWNSLNLYKRFEYLLTLALCSVVSLKRFGFS